MIFFKKIIRNAIDYGPIIALRKCIFYLLMPVFKRCSYVIYSIDLRTTNFPSLNLPEEFKFCFITENEPKFISQIEEMEEWLKGKLKHYLQHGGKCLVALKEDTVAGFNLVAFDYIHIPLVNFLKPLRPRECFSVQITVNRKFRRKKLGTYLRILMFAALKDDGYYRLYGATQVSNKINRALSQKVGFREISEITYTRIILCNWKTIKRIHKK